MHRDPRYDAVGSSTLREELYNTFLKGRAVTPQAQAEPAVKAEDPSTRQERRDKAVREREEKVRADRRKLDSAIEKSRMGVDREEGERVFRFVSFISMERNLIILKGRCSLTLYATLKYGISSFGAHFPDFCCS